MGPNDREPNTESINDDSAIDAPREPNTLEFQDREPNTFLDDREPNTFDREPNT
jgi:hypothetical protein